MYTVANNVLHPCIYCMHLLEGVVLTRAHSHHPGSSQRQTSALPLFEVSGRVKFEAVGSAPVLLDGSLVSLARWTAVLFLLSIASACSYSPSVNKSCLYESLYTWHAPVGQLV